MSKGLTCDICKKTTTVSDFDRAVLPEGFDGWLHLGVSKRVVDRSKYQDIPFNQLKYREIDICPECVNKIRNTHKYVNFESGMYDGENSLMLDLIGEIFDDYS